MASDKFNLKWNDFQQNVTNTFTKLRSQSRLFDVTLVSNDHKQIQAHKLVLSACSEFFSEIFNKNEHPNPLLYLGNVGSEDLNLVLDYIYQGEVQIYQENLDRFLNIAANLKLEGLQSNDSVTDDEVKVDAPQDEVVADHESYVKVEANARDYKPKKQKQMVKQYDLAVNSGSFESQQAELEAKFKEIVMKEGRTFTCTLCQRQNEHKGTMKRHIEIHMTGLRYDCQQCGKTFRYQRSLDRHCNGTNHDKQC